MSNYTDIFGGRAFHCGKDINMVWREPRKESCKTGLELEVSVKPVIFNI